MGENGKGWMVLTFPANSKNWLQESRTVSNLVPSHCPVFPLCFSSVHLIEIAIILKIQPRMQIIAQKTGYKKVVRLSVNWVELRTVCLYAFKWSNTISSFFFFFKFLIWSFLLVQWCEYAWVKYWQTPISLCDCHFQRQVKEIWGSGGLMSHHLWLCEHRQFWNEENRNLNNYSNP